MGSKSLCPISSSLKPRPGHQGMDSKSIPLVLDQGQERGFLKLREKGDPPHSFFFLCSLIPQSQADLRRKHMCSIGRIKVESSNRHPSGNIE